MQYFLIPNQIFSSIFMLLHSISHCNIYYFVNFHGSIVNSLSFFTVFNVCGLKFWLQCVIWRTPEHMPSLGKGPYIFQIGGRGSHSITLYYSRTFHYYSFFIIIIFIIKTISLINTNERLKVKFTNIRMIRISNDFCTFCFLETSLVSHFVWLIFGEKSLPRNVKEKALFVKIYFNRYIDEIYVFIFK